MSNEPASTPQSSLPSERIEDLNGGSLRTDGDHVLYWMVAARRPGWNFALDQAVELARELGKPLVILEALRSGYRWASDRLHAFALQGMAANARAFAKRRVTYHPYVEPAPGAGSGLLEALAEGACCVVTDDFPCFFVPRMQAAAADRIGVRMERVDSNGLYPLRATERVFPSAHTLRRHLQKELRPHLDAFPKADPLAGRTGLPEPVPLPEAVRERWPAATDALLEATPAALARLPIDHDVAPAEGLPGGFVAGRERLRAFLSGGLALYSEHRNQPDRDATSGLSPYLHFGHVSAHEVFAALADDRGWTPGRISKQVTGSREGWWGLDPNAESFLDELVTWRELGFHFTAKQAGYDRFETLPEFARQTLDEHRDDPRPHLYDLAGFEAAATHDEIWNAAQRELVTTGRMHNYLRMLWGKKVLEWSESPEQALEVLIHLNNKYAVDGRDPNSYSGIFWCLGRFDRAWGPERPVFGKVRYMSSDSTRRKLRLAEYLERFGEPSLFS